MTRELFGTDGVRGLAGEYPLDDVGAKQIGMAVGTHFCQPGQSVVIGCDTRQSSPGLVEAVSGGLVAMGVKVVSVGVIPTPGLAYLTRENDFVAGVMITASHNPYQYNGIKVFDGNGDKLDDEAEAELNRVIDLEIDARAAGSVVNDSHLLQMYEDFLVSTAGGLQLQEVQLAIDCANGAASGLAARVFKRLGAEVTSTFDEPDGLNINDHCGATDTTALQDAVTKNHLSGGIAVDGDADRLILVDDQGRDLNGDHIMYLLAVHTQASGVVATTMSNLGFEQALAKAEIKLVRTHVGDRYVLDGLNKTGYRIGGEQSGHIIIHELLKTGDALLAAVQVLRAVQESRRSLAQWRNEVPLLPQAIVNIPLSDKTLLDLPDIKKYIADQTATLGAAGRILIRPSGTEPLVRVMVEAPQAEARVQQISAELTNLLKEGVQP